jgi:hypothetical protein
MGCRNGLILELAYLPENIPTCDWDHAGGYSREAFDRYAVFVAELRRRRMDLGLDQMDLGAAMGMADGYVNKLESFARVASHSTLLLWAQSVGLELVGHSGALPAATLEVVERRRALQQPEPSQSTGG